jgi:hypothetical protein
MSWGAEAALCWCDRNLSLQKRDRSKCKKSPFHGVLGDYSILFNDEQILRIRLYRELRLLKSHILISFIIITY